MAATAQPLAASGRPAPGTGRYAADAWQALGSHVSLVVADAGRLDAARSATKRLLSEVDRACSRFRPDSDLARANACAGRWVRVHPLLVAALAAAVEAAEQTDGLVDPTLGHAIAALEVTQPGASSPTPPARPAVLPRPVRAGAWRDLGLDPDGAVRVPRGAALDLGATGKAFTADVIAELVPALAGTALMISVGGDVTVGQLPDERPHLWRIAVTEQSATPAETVSLDHGGMATSSVLSPRWWHAGGLRHHLIDPRTGRPVEQVWRTASIKAPSCLAANTASTAAIVLGAAAAGWLAERRLAARLVSRDGDVLRLAGWPDPAR